MQKSETLDDRPWHRQFWPWVLIAIPATTVVACAVMITLAIVTDDGLVSDDYYREGLAINKKIEASKDGVIEQ